MWAYIGSFIGALIGGLLYLGDEHIGVFRAQDAHALLELRRRAGGVHVEEVVVALAVQAGEEALHEGRVGVPVTGVGAGREGRQYRAGGAGAIDGRGHRGRGRRRRT